MRKGSYRHRLNAEVSEHLEKASSEPSMKHLKMRREMQEMREFLVPCFFFGAGNKKNLSWVEYITGWWFQIFFFHPYLGKIPILINIFQMGWNHQPVFHGAGNKKNHLSWVEYITGWWFQIFFFHPYLGKIPILTNIFQMGWNHQPVFHGAGNKKNHLSWVEYITGWWFQICFFHPYLGKIPILTNIFQMGWNHQPVFHGAGNKKNHLSWVEYITGWWFQILFFFTRTWGRFPFWLTFFKWVETTNQFFMEPETKKIIWVELSLFNISTSHDLTRPEKVA